MELSIKLFGIAREIVGTSELEIELEEQSNVLNLLTQIKEKYPEFAKLSSLAIAVNAEYALHSQILQPHDEVALIPPVSGG